MIAPLLPGRVEKHAVKPVHREVKELAAEPDARQRDQYPVNEQAHPDRQPQCLRQERRYALSPSHLSAPPGNQMMEFPLISRHLLEGTDSPFGMIRPACR